jgi:ABC-type branched-subunit amino acid transport system ATPase component
MSKLDYVKIQNFKVYGDEITIHLENVSILIGANNSGKTSAIQALALWSWAVKIWFEKKKNSKSKAERNKGVALNRLEIAQVPIKETRYFWNQAKVRQNSNDNIGLTIKVGLWYKGHLREVGMLFKYHSPDLIYCQPTEASYHENLLEYANNLKVHLLYPMSGIGDREFVFQEEAIRTQIGIGQTANVLRNICYHLFVNSKEDWNYLKHLMTALFSIQLNDPFVRATGSLELLYNYAEKDKKADFDLDITLAGKGQQQMLLVMAYLIANQNAVLMIDEPDAHLEILRQSQIFSTIKDIALKYNCQIIIVTHSEVVLNEAASINFIMDGKVVRLDDRNHFKFVKSALKDFGIEHYYKAQLNPHLLYVESSSDISMLKAFAKKLNHPSLAIFEGKLNFYYTQNERAEDNLDNEIQRKGGFYKRHREHYNALKIVVPQLKAIGVFDGDNKGRQDEVQDDFAVYYWKRYELENYFITPKTILAFAQKEWIKNGVTGLFLSEKIDHLNKIIEEKMILPVLDNDKAAFGEFKAFPENLLNVQFQSLSSTKKLSTLLENVWETLAITEEQPVLLSKGNFYNLINYLENIPSEITEKLDLIHKYLSN